MIRGKGAERILEVLNIVRHLSGINSKAKVHSENSLGYKTAKGLGFSSSAGAALATAAYKAASLDKKFNWDTKMLSRISRRLAGSACRSVVGGFARWIAGVDDESSYAKCIGGKSELDLGIVIVPIPSAIRTEDVHQDVLSSPFFESRVENAQRRADKMEKAIREGNLDEVGLFAEQDSLELHALTMTGNNGIFIFTPESVKVIHLVRRLRKEGIKAYFSMQTGPSVFINTYPENMNILEKEVRKIGLTTLTSRIGGPAKILNHKL